MRNIIEPLTRIPGVRTAALVTTDGVLISMHSSSDGTRGAPEAQRAAGSGAEERSERSEGSASNAALDPQALAGLATSWLSEVTRAVAPLAWQPPRHLVLRAARGTMIVCEAPGAILCVVLDSGMQPEELRVPMGVTIARMQRHLRDVSQRSQRTGTEPAQQRSAVPSGAHTTNQPPGIRRASPSSQPIPLGQDERIVHATGKGVSDVSGD